MIKLFSQIKERKKKAVSSVILSIISLAAIVAVVGALSFSTGAFAGSSVAGAVFIETNAASGNNLTVYVRSANGHLSSTGTSYVTGGKGTGSALASQGAVVLTQDGRWLLAVDAGSNQITVFGVRGTTLVWKSNTSSHGTDPISLTISGNLVYVLDAGSSNIAGFRLNSQGALTFISGSNKPLSGMASPSPEQIGFNPQGNILVVTEKGTNIIDTYIVSPTGVASKPWSQTSAGSGPYGFAFTTSGLLIVSEAASNSVSSYNLSSTGRLVTINGALPTFGNAPCWIAVNGDNKFTYTTNAHSGTISTFKIHEDGALSLYSSIAAHAATPTLDMAFNHNGNFLYVRNGVTITGYLVTANGAISAITNSNEVPASAAGLAAL